MELLLPVKVFQKTLFVRNPTEEEWSILQILSHVKEATPYWLNEIKRVLEQPGCEWGRGLQDVLVSSGVQSW